VHPKYLEKLVAKVFANSGQYAEVRHVGRPDDGGVDVVLVESNESTWLVQVKRRKHPNSVEPVSTVRNLLGTLILSGSDRGIVVSTADHFSFRAKESVGIASQCGYTVRLIDRKAFGHLIAGCLPSAPWKKVLAAINADRVKWFGAPDDIASKQVEWTVTASNGKKMDAINAEQLTLF
jgi:Restriction endonuclease